MYIMKQNIGQTPIIFFIMIISLNKNMQYIRQETNIQTLLNVNFVYLISIIPF